MNESEGNKPVPGQQQDTGGSGSAQDSGDAGGQENTGAANRNAAPDKKEQRKGEQRGQGGR
jgi:hypothetical protein